MTGVVGILVGGVAYRVIATPAIATGVRSGNGPVSSNIVTISTIPAATITATWTLDSGTAVASNPTGTSTAFTDNVIVGEPSSSTFTGTAFIGGTPVGSVFVPVELTAI